MAQSALTVTPPNPTPPTNFACVGATPPSHVPNYTKTSYANPFDLLGFGSVAGAGSGGAGIIASGANSTTINADGRPDMTMPGVGVNPNPPPYFDDGTAQGTLPNSGVLAFAANTAALASGTGATSGGTENTFPGTGTMPGAAFGLGAVPASTSVAHEGAGTEVVVTQTYPVSAANVIGVMVPGSAASYVPTGQTPAWAAGDPGGPVRGFSDLGNFTGVASPPNQQHASSLSPATNPTLTTIAPTTAVSGTGTVALTAVTGVGFTRQSVVYANGVAIPTVYVSSTTLTATMPKKATSGPWNITVVTGGVVTTTAQVFTWT